MEWLELMNQAIDFIETHLEGDIDINKVAQKAYSSPFHFQRMFYMLTGVTVAEYIRKRKLSLAAHELASSGLRGLDIALKYGYESPESFGKAFRKAHGVAPSEARKSGVYLKAFPRLVIRLSLTGEQEIKYRIIEKERFQIIGKGVKVMFAEKKNQIAAFWEESLKNGYIGMLESMAAGSSGKMGACMGFNPAAESFIYFLGAVKPELIPPGDLSESTIPAATWAVFESTGPLPEAEQKVRSRIYTEWFPATGYEQADCTEFAIYPPGRFDDANYRCEIWLPVCNKEPRAF